MPEAGAERRLARLIAKYSPEVAAVARLALKKMQARFPGAVRMVYDNYNALVIGFGPTERASDALFSIALYPKWVNLFFLKGASLPDPGGLLKGSGSRVRSIRLTSAATLDAPAVCALMAHALEASQPFGPWTSGRLIIRSVSSKQRARRS
jgi:Domain of unknown function (DU1801)